MLRSLVLVWVLVLLAACSSVPYQTQEQTVDGLTIALELPQEPRTLEQYDFYVTLTDSNGQPVSDAEVFFDFTMPAMPMGVNQPVAEPLGDGRYGANTLFSMEGYWHIAVHAVVDGREYVAIFDEDVAPE